MNVLNFARLLATGVMLTCTLAGYAQQQSKKNADSEGRFDVAVLYQATRSNPVGGSNFWIHGGSTQLHAQLWHGLGGVAEFAGAHNGKISSSGLGLDLFTLTFGPRYTWRYPNSHVSFYGQALMGKAFGRNSLFPSSSGSANSSAGSLAFSLGGGVNYALRHQLTLRAVQADWMRTQLPNSTTNVQNNFRIGAGLALHFK